MPTTIEKRKKIRNIVLICVVAALALASIPFLRSLSVEDLVAFTPENPFLAALVLLALYCIKPLFMFFPVLVLYMAAGVMFPPFWAIFVTLLGISCEFTIGYFAGRRLGTAKVRQMIEKRPKAANFFGMVGRNSATACFLTRLIPMPVPLDLISMFYGATGVSYGTYLIFSLLGIAATGVPLVLAGDALADPFTPEFLVPFGISVGLAVVLAVISLVLSRRRNKTAGQTGEEGEGDHEETA